VGGREFFPQIPPISHISPHQPARRVQNTTSPSARLCITGHVFAIQLPLPPFKSFARQLDKKRFAGTASALLSVSILANFSSVVDLDPVGSETFWPGRIQTRIRPLDKKISTFLHIFLQNGPVRL
jgi:hypothetical protein